jgi:hypothetical protein
LEQDWSKTFFITTPVILLGLGAGYLLYKDYKKVDVASEISEDERVQIGVLSTSENSVKRKADESPYWNDLVIEEPVFDKDSIRTGSNSKASIRLRDSSVIELGPNSLILLEQNSQKLSVNLKLGDLSTQGKSKDFSIKVKDSVIQAENSKLRLKTDNANNTEINVDEGQALLVNQKSKVEKRLGKMNETRITSDGNLESKVLLVKLTSPKDQTVVLESAQTLSKELMYPFTWTVFEEDRSKGEPRPEQVFELSRTKEFTPDKVYSRKSSLAISAPLTKGTWYWRVGATQNPGSPIQYTEIRSLKLEEDVKINLVYPKNKSGFSLESDANQVEFNWEASVNSQNYLIEVSSDQQFTRLIKTLTTQKAPLTVKDFAPGNYFWRVRAFNIDKQEIAASTVYSFSVNVRLPELPKLLSPMNLSKISQTDTVDFTWESFDEAQNYRITVSKDVNQNEIIKAATLTTNKFTWSKPQVGTFYWEIQSFNEDRKLLAQSTTHRFTIVPKIAKAGILLLQPANEALVQRVQKTNLDPILFTWQPEKVLVGPYRLMISSDPEFKSNVQRFDMVPNTRQLVTLNQAGTYSWKVTWMNPKDPADYIESETNVLIYKLSNQLPAPLLEKPLDSERFEFTGTETVLLSWKPVEAATGYRVQAYREIDSQVPLIDQVVTETQFTTTLSEPGAFLWTVTALDRESREGLSSQQRKFMIELKRELSAPKLKPAVVK